MKIVCIDNALNNTGEPYMSVRSDSSVLRNNDTFYVPSFTEDLRFTAGYMLRINRLAKCVGEGFAWRCFDAVGMAVAFTAHDIVKRNCALGTPCDEAYCFDKSIALSPESVAVDEIGDGQFELKFRDCTLRGSFGDLKFPINEAVARASELLTLKTGDIVYVAATDPISVSLGDDIEVSLGERNMLDFQIR